MRKNPCKKGLRKEPKNVADAVMRIAAPLAEEQGLVIWDIEYGKEGGQYVLRITIDCEDGVDLDRCETFHRAIDPLLDAEDPIADSYILEVSSPGIERELKTDFHLSACEGWEVEVKLYTPVDGKKVYYGTLLPCGDGKVEIAEKPTGKNQPILHRSFDRKSVAKVRTCYDFSDS